MDVTGALLIVLCIAFRMDPIYYKITLCTCLQKVLNGLIAKEHY